MPLVIFDWDGTLMDSTAQIVRTVRAAAADVGVAPPAPAAVQHIIGLSLDIAMQRLFPAVPETQRAALLAAYARRFSAGDGGAAGLFEGARALIDDLALTCDLAIATGKSRRGLDRVLHEQGWQERFQVTRCADESASKPDPRMLYDILERLGYAAHEAVMVGDTSYDLAMARAAGMPAIGVSWGAHARPLLAAENPLTILDSMAALRQYLQHRWRAGAVGV